MIHWDGVKRWNKDWNQDLTMEQAFKVTAVPYLPGSSQENWKRHNETMD